MGDPDPWDNQVMFERYLYDYLKKRNMHRTAEIFRRETTIPIDPSTPPSIDVPDGFLHEWWLIFYDIFRSRHLSNQENIQAAAVIAESFTAAGLHTAATPKGHCESNGQTIRNLNLSSESGTIAAGGSLLPSVNWPSTGDLPISQPLSLPQCQQSSPNCTSRPPYQQGLLTSASGATCPAGNLSSLIAPGVGLSANPKLRMDDMEPNEGVPQMAQLHSSSKNQQEPIVSAKKDSPGNLSDLKAQGAGSSARKASKIDIMHKKDQGSRLGNGSSNSQSGSQGMPQLADSPSEASMLPRKSSSSRARDNNSEASDSLSNSRRGPAASKRRASER